MNTKNYIAEFNPFQSFLNLLSEQKIQAKEAVTTAIKYAHDFIDPDHTLSFTLEEIKYDDGKWSVTLSNNCAPITIETRKQDGSVVIETREKTKEYKITLTWQGEFVSITK